MPGSSIIPHSMPDCLHHSALVTGLFRPGYALNAHAEQVSSRLMHLVFGLLRIFPHQLSQMVAMIAKQRDNILQSARLDVLRRFQEAVARVAGAAVSTMGHFLCPFLVI